MSIMKIQTDFVEYTIRLTSYTKGEPDTFELPGHAEEVEYDIISILPTTGAGFVIDDIVQGDPEMSELIIEHIKKQQSENLDLAITFD